MAIYETFAKRKQKAEMSGIPMVYVYDILPQPFRGQVVYIWRSVFGEPRNRTYPYSQTFQDIVWHRIHTILAQEMGVFWLVENGPTTYFAQCELFLLTSEDVDQVLSLIEIAFKTIDTDVRVVARKPGNDLGQARTPQTLDDAIKELNVRFQEHSIGYQYEAGQIIQMDSQYLHAETVEPAISLLHDARFEGALQEFMNAHKHYRERNNKEAITEALKAFESTMKTICDRRRLGYAQNDTASKLIKTLFDNHIVPLEMESQFNSLRSTLESGVPTLRNKKGGHGQGSEPMEVPAYIAAYALHLTASNIVFLISAHNS